MVKGNKMATKPVRIELEIYELLEKEAVNRTTQSGKIVQISTVANDILKNHFEMDKENDGSTKKEGRTTETR